MATKKQGETTSKRVATQAAKVLRDPGATQRQKSIAGSALTQAANKKRK
jgi:hypothetical protein